MESESTETENSSERRRLLSPESDDDTPKQTTFTSINTEIRKRKSKKRDSNRMSVSNIDASILLQQDYNGFVEALTKEKRKRDLRIILTLFVAFVVSTFLMIIFPRVPALHVSQIVYSNFTYNLNVTNFSFAVDLKLNISMYNPNFYSIRLQGVNLTISTYDIFLGYLAIPPTDANLIFPFHSSNVAVANITLNATIPAQCFVDPTLADPLENLMSNFLQGYIQISLKGHPKVLVWGLNLTIPINEILIVEPFRFIESKLNSNFTVLNTTTAVDSTNDFEHLNNLPSYQRMYNFYHSTLQQRRRAALFGVESADDASGSGSGSSTPHCPLIIS
eukprot:TRINITY_DN12974_c0_g1_i1.p1 TRINITY_DN12974_c0_g1~~TRINITY_DN12974_c0_g1_i1.p1  ORF type:complete len:333 (-),score=24.62 TRINITY_DN12974_c0_g1_i1:83-1081(-)